MRNKNKVITLSVISVLAICVISVLFFIKTNINEEEQVVKENKYETHIASTPTTRIGGLITYNKSSDLIIDIPEEVFLDFNGSGMTYDELVSEIGEPSGYYGSGIVRSYWRIGEDKYGVCESFGQGGVCYIIVDGQNSYVKYSDLIIDIPEEAFLNFNDRDHTVTYNEVVSEFGEPSGSCGNGIASLYWRIGENKYAVCDCIEFCFFICDAQDVLTGSE